MNTLKTSVISLILLTFGLIFSIAETNFAYADEKSETAKVVFHADYANPQRMSAMLTSIFNMVTTYENEFMEYDIRIVFLSHGIQFLTHDRLKGTPFEVDDKQAKLRKDLITRLITLHDMQNINSRRYHCYIRRCRNRQVTKPGLFLFKSTVVSASSQSFNFASRFVCAVPQTARKYYFPLPIHFLSNR